jgi:hypothetical protein
MITVEVFLLAMERSGYRNKFMGHVGMLYGQKNKTGQILCPVTT